MSWIDRIRPGINKLLQKRESPDNLWVKDPDTGEMLYKTDLENSQWVTPSGRHMRIGPELRFRDMFDGESWLAIDTPRVVEVQRRQEIC